jgi:hypothetical protein
MNTPLLLWSIIVLSLVNGLIKIILGAAGGEKSTSWNALDTIDGLIVVVLMILVIAT